MSERVIPDQTLASNMRKTLMTLCDVVDGWQNKCADQAKQISDLQAENARLKQPVSDEEWEPFAMDYIIESRASRSKEQAQEGDANGSACA